jgi:hypothetical protein
MTMHGTMNVKNEEEYEPAHHDAQKVRCGKNGRKQRDCSSDISKSFRPQSTGARDKQGNCDWDSTWIDISDRERCTEGGRKGKENRKEVGCGYGDIRQSKKNDNT